jgi:hypothetical protein
MVRYYDKDQSLIYLPTKKNLVLSYAANPLGKMMVVVARKPSIDGELRGQFDDVLGIQLLRNRFALLAMEAAEKSVQAPIVLPQDVQELQLGGDAVIRTANLTRNFAQVLVTQRDVQVISMQASLLVKAYKHSWVHLIHRSSQHRQSLHLLYAMLLACALKSTRRCIQKKRPFVV